MQLIVEIPDDIIARSINDTVELSLDIGRKGTITEVYNQEYGFRNLTFTSMNCLNRIDILKLKHKLEEEEDNNESFIKPKDIPIYDFSGVKRID